MRRKYSNEEKGGSLSIAKKTAVAEKAACFYSAAPALSFLMIAAAARPGFFLMLCSHILATRQPAAFSCLAAFLSLTRLPDIFFFQ